MIYENYKVDDPVKVMPALDFTKVTKIYVGKDDACRCGCEGTYYDDPNSRGWKSAITKFKKLFDLGCIREVKYEKSGNSKWVNIPYGEKHLNRCFTFYL